MPLTDFVERYSHIIDGAFEKPMFNIRAGIKAPPTTNPRTVGMAFDYLLRLQVARWNTNKLIKSNQIFAPNKAEAKRYLAEDIFNFPERAVNGNKKRKDFIHTIREKTLGLFNDQVTIYELISDCIVLAKLDPIARGVLGDYPNSEIFSANQDNIIDLTHLINIVDPNLWIASKHCWLNPCFGKSSEDVGGADADIIIDDRLIEIKTVKELVFERRYFRQLMGYHILNTREHDMYGSFKRCGIYFSRFGVLFECPTPQIRPPTNRDLIPKGKSAGDGWDLINDCILEYNGTLKAADLDSKYNL